MNEFINIRRLIVGLLGVILLLALTQSVVAQTNIQCQCSVCPDTIFDGKTKIVNFNISGAIDSTLGVNKQSVCAVYLKFRHDFINDLTIKLRSPFGTEVILIGPSSSVITTSLTKNTRWDLIFIDSTQKAQPDTPFTSKWNNEQKWSNFVSYSGTYYPYSGTLNDFNKGKVNGLWQLIIEDSGPDPISRLGILEYAQIEFCNTTGIGCKPCRAEVGTFADKSVKICTGDSSALLHRPNVIFPTGKPNSKIVTNEYLLLKDSVVLKRFDDVVNLKGYPIGNYKVYGFSYSKTDSLMVSPLVNLTINKLKDSLSKDSLRFCAKLSNDSLHIQLLPSYKMSFSYSLCYGESIIMNNKVYNQSGIFIDTLPTVGGCDSVIERNIFIRNKIETNQTIRLCSKNTLTVGNTVYSKSGNYIDTLTSIPTGCDSIVYTNLTIEDSIVVRLDRTICQGDTFYLGTTHFTRTGIYQQKLKSVLGCDSTVYLNLTVHPRTTASITKTICEGESYTIGKSVYTTPGPKLDTLLNSNGCDSIVFLNLFLEELKRDDKTVSICAGQTYGFGKNILASSGFYCDTFPNVTSNGCDSVSKLSLIVRPPIKNKLVQVICKGQSFQVGQNIYTKTGAYNDTFPNAAKNGCDSIVQLFLFAKEPTTFNYNIEICEGETYQIGDIIYTATGSYVDTIQANDGCDSLIKVRVKVNPRKFNTVYASICQGDYYRAGASFYGKAGTYLDTLISNSTGCDSVVLLHLSVVDKFEVSIDTSICQGGTFTVGTKSYSQTGTYRDTLTSKAGCDSIIQTNLTILKTYNDTLRAAVCSGNKYIFGKDTITMSGIYSKKYQAKNGCDSSVVLILNHYPSYSYSLDTTICEGQSIRIGQSMYNKSGTYINKLITKNEGCDSVINLKLTVNPILKDTLKAKICNGKSYNFYGLVLKSPGTYAKQIVGKVGCDTIRTLILNVIDSVSNVRTAFLCIGDSVLLYGKWVKKSGTYSQKYVSVDGCDSTDYTIINTFPKPPSKTISMRVCMNQTIRLYGKDYTGNGLVKDTVMAKGPSPCDTTVYISIEFKDKFTEKDSATRCQGDTVIIGNQKLYQTGNYDITLKSKFGCDSIISFKLAVNPVKVTQIDTALCSKESIKVGNQTYSLPGTYQKKLSTNLGCDSIVNITIRSVQYKIKQSYKEICQGDSVIFRKFVCKTSGTYYDTVRLATGCDSVYVFNLLVLFSHQQTYNETICAGDSVAIKGKYYSRDTILNYTIQASKGCDTTVYILVNVIPKIKTNDSKTICKGDSLILNGKTYKNEGVYDLAFKSVLGCDSMVTLQLNHYPVITSTIYLKKCPRDSVFYENQYYKNEGVYSVRLKNSLGCDSLINLTVESQTPDTVLYSKQICQGDSLNFKNIFYSKTGFYKILSKDGACDTVWNLDLMVNAMIVEYKTIEICQGDTVYINGKPYFKAITFAETYPSSGGCDSIVNYTISIKPIYQNTVLLSSCSNKTLIINGKEYASDADVPLTYNSSLGCDSTVTYQLRFTSLPTKSIASNICEGKSMVIHGKTYTESGTYIDTLRSIQNCDTILTIMIKQLLKSYSSSSVSICQGDSALVFGRYVKAAGVYKDTFINVSGCDSIAEVSLKLLLPTQSFIDTTICSGDSIFIQNKYYSLPSVYEIKIKNSQGCDSIIQFKLSLKSCTVNADISATDASCFGLNNGSIRMKVFGGNKPYKIVWTNTSTGEKGNGIIDEPDSFFDIPNRTAGTYTIEITDVLGFKFNKTIQVGQATKITVAAVTTSNYNGFSTRCPDSKDGYVTTKVSGGTSFYSFAWNNGSLSQDLDKLGAGTYSLTVTDRNGCVDSTFKITLKSPPKPVINLLVKSPVCYDSTNASIQVTVNGLNAPYQFALNTLNFGQINSFPNLPTGNYTIHVRDNNICIFDTGASILRPNPLFVSIDGLKEVKIGEYTELKAITPSNAPALALYQWSTGTACSTCDTAMVRPIEPTTYYVTVTDLNGCMASSKIDIRVRQIEPTDIPNAITPNDDGMNDAFILDFLNQQPSPFPDNEIFIYNRWGEIVYRAKPYNNDWKGTNQSGLPLPAGTYYYSLKLSIPNGSVFEGNITILK